MNITTTSICFSTKGLLTLKPFFILRNTCCCYSSSSLSCMPRGGISLEMENEISNSEWQAWGSSSLLPKMVNEIVKDMKNLEHNVDVSMAFGGLGGKLKGDFKAYEDAKHRATYQALGNSEEKLQFFSARQIACRLLGSRGYLCQKCWLPLGDCMCSNIVPCALQHGIRFWLYMHPKDFLRQNNTGKLLWQVFGVKAATLCLYGIPEHEEIMWDAFKLSGKNKVWCLYPNKNEPTQSVQDAFTQGSLTVLKCNADMTTGDNNLNFVLLDGTWNNSAAMFRRLKDRAQDIWEETISCISLSPGKSPMHRLRTQPSWDRTCTAAAAAGLLSELELVPELSSLGFDKQSEAVEDSLSALLDALTKRRLRMGRSIARKEKHNRDIL